MNHKKIKKQIKKINAFFQSISADDEISKIEKDLLLTYISRLYESVLDHDANVVSKPRKENKQRIAPPTPAVEKKEAPATVTVIERKPFERAEISQPVVNEVKAAVQEEVIMEAAVVEDAVAVKETMVQQTTTGHVEASKVGLSENMALIFEKSGGTEISDRLSNLPLKDLTKAMGINERMFTIKELFGGNQDRFKTVMTTINKLSGFDEAKEYLISGIATELEWDSEDNYKKADKFVKLVQRRFS